MKRLVFTTFMLTFVLSPNMYSMSSQSQASQPASTPHSTSVEEKPLCPICMDDTSTKPLAMLACGNGHIFHETCILNYANGLSRNNMAPRNATAAPLSLPCPLCRAEVREPLFLNPNVALIKAAQCNKISIVEQYLKMHVAGKLSVPEQFSLNTALAYAVLSGHTSIVRLLLTHPDTDPNAVRVIVNAAGEKEERFMLFCAPTKILQLLLDHPKTDPNLRDNLWHLTALMHAAINADEKRIEVLTTNPKVNPTLRSITGDTALDFIKLKLRYTSAMTSERKNNLINCYSLLLSAEEKWNATHPTTTAPTKTTTTTPAPANRRPFDITEID